MRLMTLDRLTSFLDTPSRVKEIFKSKRPLTSKALATSVPRLGCGTTSLEVVHTALQTALSAPTDR